MSGAPDDTAAVSELRTNLWNAGFRPVPVFNHDANVPSPGKQPLGAKWQLDARKSPPFCATSPAVKHALNTGVLTDGLRPIDFDIDDPDKAVRCRALASAMLGAAPLRTRQGSPRALALYAAAEGEPAKRTLTGRSHTKEHSCKIEVLGKGQQFVAFGRHQSGADLEWHPEPPGISEPRDTLIAIAEDQVQAFLEACAPIIDAPMPARPNGHDHDHTSAEPQADSLRIAAALAEIPNHGPADWESWNRVGMAVWRATAGSAAGWEAFNAWSSRNLAYDPKATRTRWDHYATSPPTSIGAGTIFHMAAESAGRPYVDPDDPGPTDEPEADQGPSDKGEATGGLGTKANPKPKPSPSPTVSLQGYDLTEDGIALAFAKEHQDLLRYDHSIGRWFQWTGKAWRQDETKLAFSWSRRTCRQLAKKARAKDKLLATLAKAATAAAVERFAQSDPALAVTSAIWDRDPFLLGTPAGTLDLRTAELRDPVREDHITKLTSVAPSVMPDCPLWLRFLDEVTEHNAGLIRFLKQFCGYCLTGDIREHELLFAHGPGGNGKTVFINIVRGILDDYAVNAAMDTFVASQSDKHPTDLAMLRGARLVTASETEEGRAWAEARIKALTGGDPITARFMRQDFFEFYPQFKLFIIGNHKPVLRNVDEASRRRINMIPFHYKPPIKDKQLEAKLKKEAPGILRWMIEGCLDWQKNGLIQPDVVTQATAEYFSEQDTVNQWVEEACILGTTQSDTLAILFKSWTDYALANGEKPGTTKWFSQTLTRLGCEAVKSTPGNRGKRGFKGIAVKLVETRDRTEPYRP